MYDLKSVSDDYEEFLTAIGIPSFAVFFILRGSETLEMEILEDGSVQSKTITGHHLFRSDLLPSFLWHMILPHNLGYIVKVVFCLDFQTQEHRYEFDKEWTMEYGKGMGVMHVICTREELHILVCRCEKWYCDIVWQHNAVMNIFRSIFWDKKQSVHKAQARLRQCFFLTAGLTLSTSSFQLS